MGKIKRNGETKFVRTKKIAIDDIEGACLYIEKLAPKEGEIVLIKDPDNKLTQENYKAIKTVLDMAGINNYLMIMKGGMDMNVLKIRSKKDVIVIEDSETDPLKGEHVQAIFEKAGIKNKVMILDAGMKAKIQ
jgi:hypothetical protein